MGSFINSLRSRFLWKYIIGEVFVTFAAGTLVFLLLIWSMQSLKFFEYVVLRQVSLVNVAKLSYYLSQSTLTIAIPIAFLFSVIWGISRAKSEGEILAMEASGISALQAYALIFVSSCFLVFICGWLALYVVPNGQNKLENMLKQIGVTTVISGFKSGTFTEGFSGMMFYAEEANGDQIKKVFIYDKRDPKAHYAITAQSASIRNDEESSRVTLRLADGSIHAVKQGNQDLQRRIDFDIYDVNLNVNRGHGITGWHSIPEFTYPMLMQRRRETKDAQYKIRLDLEVHRRLAMAFCCLVFGALGYFIALQSKRGMGSSSVVICLLVATVYWLCYVWATVQSLRGVIPVWLGVWLPNIIFGLLPIYFYRRYRLNP